MRIRIRIITYILILLLKKTIIYLWQRSFFGHYVVRCSSRGGWRHWGPHNVTAWCAPLAVRCHSNRMPVKIKINKNRLRSVPTYNANFFLTFNTFWCKRVLFFNIFFKFLILRSQRSTLKPFISQGKVCHRFNLIKSLKLSYDIAKFL